MTKIELLMLRNQLQVLRDDLDRLTTGSECNGCGAHIEVDRHLSNHFDAVSDAIKFLDQQARTMEPAA